MICLVDMILAELLKVASQHQERYSAVPHWQLIRVLLGRIVLRPDSHITFRFTVLCNLHRRKHTSTQYRVNATGPLIMQDRYRDQPSSVGVFK